MCNPFRRRCDYESRNRSTPGTCRNFPSAAASRLSAVNASHWRACITSARFTLPAACCNRSSDCSRERAVSLLQNPHPAIDQFGIFQRIDIHHQVSVRLADLHHRQRGHGIQHQFGGGACFETRRSGEYLRAGGEWNVQIRNARRQFHMRGIGADQKNRLSRSCVGFDQRSMHIGRRSPRRDAEDDILPRNFGIDHRLFSRRRIIFHVLDGPPQRRVSARNQAHHHRRIRAKRRRTLRSVQHSQPPRCPVAPT